MQRLFNFKSLKKRILTGFILIITLIAAFTVYSFIINTSMEKKAEELINHQLKMLSANQTLATSITVQAAAATNFITTSDDKYLEIFQTYSDKADEQIKYLDEIDPDGKEKRQNHVEEETQWREDIQNKVFAPHTAGDTNTAINNLRELNDQATIVRTGYDELVNENKANIEKLGKEVIEEANDTKVGALTLSLLIILSGIIIAIYSANSISRPVKKITERLVSMSNGDISNQSFQTNRKDELGTLMRATNELTEKMKTILSNIHTISENVAFHSEELAQSSEEIKTGSEQIAQTMNEIADGTDTQSKRTVHLADAVAEFKNNVQEAANEGKSLYELSGDVQKLTNSGQQVMDKTANQMHTIDEIVNEAVVKVESLNEQSKQITKLVSVISDIADQTNLLALNAAIEAAQAGEAGKGFAVVADEVKKLAEQVQFSVSDISKIVDSIQTETNEVTKSLHLGYDEVKKGTVQMAETSNTFNAISNSIEMMIQNIKNISSNLQIIDVKTEKINETISDIAAVTEESAAGIQQTSATIQETTSSIEEIANSTEQLAQMAEQLKDEVFKFKLA